VLRYKRHYFMASGIEAQRRRRRIPRTRHPGSRTRRQTGRAHRAVGRRAGLQPGPPVEEFPCPVRGGQQFEGNGLEDLVAERIAVDSYREIIQYIGDKDPTTRRIFEDILAQEEEHADDMADILESL
jgi:bacterioferritin